MKMFGLGSNLAILKELRDAISNDNDNSNISEENWESLTSIAISITEACSRRDLNEVAASARRLKNRLRKRSIREQLNPDENDDGDCKCSVCGKTINGTAEPCIKGSKCVKCALDNKGVEQDSDKEDDINKDKKESRQSYLRTRGYVTE